MKNFNIAISALLMGASIIFMFTGSFTEVLLCYIASKVTYLEAMTDES